MTDINWDDMTSGEFVKFENVGDNVAGVITAVRPGTDFNGGPCPVLDLLTTSGDERTLSCGQANLKAQIVALKPKAGDTIKVTFSSTQKVEKGVKKVFTVEHNAGSAAPATTPSNDEPPF